MKTWFKKSKEAQAARNSEKSEASPESVTPKKETEKTETKKVQTKKT